jgi:hypothetical protein
MEVTITTRTREEYTLVLSMRVVVDQEGCLVKPDVSQVLSLEMMTSRYGNRIHGPVTSSRLQSIATGVGLDGEAALLDELVKVFFGESLPDFMRIEGDAPRPSFGTFYDLMQRTYLLTLHELIWGRSMFQTDSFRTCESARQIMVMRLSGRSRRLMGTYGGVDVEILEVLVNNPVVRFSWVT